MTEASELCHLLSFPEVSELGEEVEARCPPLPSAELATQMREWLLEVVAGFDQRFVELCLIFVTGKRTLSALRTGGDDRDALLVCLYQGGGEIMTAGTCSRIWYVPWVPHTTRGSLEQEIRDALLYFEKERETGSAALHYD